MTYARALWPFVLTASLAACSGNLGGGQSTLPGAPQSGTNNVQQIAPPAATSTPNSASNVATLGDSVAPQALPAVMGYSGSIAFPKSGASASPAPNASAGPVSIGITASTVEPAETPKFNAGGSKHRGKHDAGALTPLLFISLLPTADVALSEYPKIAVDVPRDVIAKHLNDTFSLALYDPEQKSKAYQLAVAERDLSSPPPGGFPSPAATPVPTPVATPTTFGMMNGPAAFTPPPVGQEFGASALPPERIAFQGTAASLSLKANRPVVFALYAIPAQPSPSPSPSGSPKATPVASPAGTLPSASPSPLPSASPSPGATSKPVNT